MLDTQEEPLASASQLVSCPNKAQVEQSSSSIPRLVRPASRRKHYLRWARLTPHLRQYLPQLAKSLHRDFSQQARSA